MAYSWVEQKVPETLFFHNRFLKCLHFLVNFQYHFHLWKNPIKWPHTSLSFSHQRWILTQLSLGACGFWVLVADVQSAEWSYSARSRWVGNVHLEEEEAATVLNWSGFSLCQGSHSTACFGQRHLNLSPVNSKTVRCFENRMLGLHVIREKRKEKQYR